MGFELERHGGPKGIAFRPCNEKCASLHCILLTFEAHTSPLSRPRGAMPASNCCAQFRAESWLLGQKSFPLFSACVTKSVTFSLEKRA